MRKFNHIKILLNFTTIAEALAIVGKSGTGKSTCIAGLNPDSTFVVQVLHKGLPFKGAKTKYVSEPKAGAKKNLARVDKWEEVSALVKGISDNRPDVKTIVLDDVGYVMAKELFERADEKGYGKFTDIAFHMYKVITSIENLRDDLVVAFMFHASDIEDTSVPEKLKIKLYGKMLEERYDPQESFSVVLYTNVSHDGDEPEYKLVTNYHKGIPAKSPRGMFEDKLIENDLSIVVDKLTEYYNS